MKLKLFFSPDRYVSEASGRTVLLGDANAILQMLQNTGVVHSIVAGDRLEDKAVNFIKMMFEQAGVGKADSASVLTGKLFEAYLQTSLEIERTLTLKVEEMLNAFGTYWRPIALPDTQKFPMQATFEVYADHYACIGFDPLNEFGQGENQWVLFLIIDTANCRTRNLIGTFTESTYRFDYKKFAEFLPALVEWTTPTANSEPQLATGAWSTYPRFGSEQTCSA